jgi:hypothetical protein
MRTGVYMLAPPVVNPQTSQVPSKDGNAGEGLIVEERSDFPTSAAWGSPACLLRARARGGSAHSGNGPRALQSRAQDRFGAWRQPADAPTVRIVPAQRSRPSL